MSFDHAGEHQVAIRQGQRSDASKVIPLVRRLVAFGPPPWRKSEALVRCDEHRIGEALKSPGPDPLVLLAVVGARVAGFIHLHSLKDQYRDRPHGHVSDLVVAEGFEGRGVGRRLLEAAETWARAQGHDWLSISVFADNHRAAAMYEKAGFGRDILRLVKPLT